MFFSYPTNDQRLVIPKTVIHGTTLFGRDLIIKHGIQSRGYDINGIPNLPKSLDFGEGFYCSYQDPICSKQVKLLAKDRAFFYKSKHIILSIEVDPLINQDSSLKCLYFDGRLDIDGLEWANFIVHHRVNKGIANCNSEPCNGHPDLMIGPVADGTGIVPNAVKVLNGEISLLDYYNNIASANWFPAYRQIVFSEKAIKYLRIL